jgi:hypothetical protein
MQQEISSSAPFPTAQKAEADARETAAKAARETNEAAAEPERSQDLSETIVQVETTVSPPAPAMESPAFAPDPVLAAEAERAASAPMPIEEARKAEENIGAHKQASSEAEAGEPVAQYSASPASESVQPATSRSERRAAAPSAAVSDSSRLLVRDPEQWLRDIRELRTTGETQEADRQWKEFETAFPDYKVAEDDPARPAE